MKKQIDVWEGEIGYWNGKEYQGFVIGEDKISDITDHIESLEGKVRVTIEVIE